jgi:hypothetical protein
VYHRASEARSSLRGNGEYVDAFAIAMTAYYFLQLGWAYFHVVRQHYGLFCLYQKKNHEVSGSANRGDYWLFNIAMFGPFVVWMFRYPYTHHLLDDLLDLSDTEGWEQPVLWLSRALILSVAVAFWPR